MSLLPHQQRVVDEKTELDGKLEKLGAFLGSSVFEKLPQTERYLLSKQRELMGGYSEILRERISYFGI